MKNLFKLIYNNIIYAIIIIVLNQSDNVLGKINYNQFLDQNFAHLPKCCAHDAALEITNTTTLCSSDKIKFTHFDISSTKIANYKTEFSNNCDNVTCIDFISNENLNWSLVMMQNCKIKTEFTNYSAFPKCCPKNYEYNTINHTCNKQSDEIYTFDNQLQVINVSLTQCGKELAIIEFQDAFIINDNDKSVNVHQYTIPYTSYCIDKNINTNKQILKACLSPEEVCGKLKKRCIKKCCPDGEVYMKRNKKGSCVPYFTASFNVSQNPRFKQSDNDYGILLATPGKKYIAKKEHEFFIDELGIFHTLNNDEWLILSPVDAYYCIDSFLTPQNELESLIFLKETDNDINKYQHLKYYIQGIIIAVSSLFMFATTLCYLFVPVLQNVHGRCILMYSIIMTIGFGLLCYVQVTPPHSNDTVCVTLGFSIVFTFLGGFAWMNVICFDMWIAFGTVKTSHLKTNKKDLKKFIYYNIYGWGVPITICGFALIVFLTKCLPNKFIPHIGTYSCYFDNRDENYDFVLYFLGPQALMQLINVILFIKTACYCYKVKNEIQKMQNVSASGNKAKRKRFLDDKETLGMLLKIFMVMGIPWTFEFISTCISLHDTSTTIIIEAIGDYINAAQGIIIFCILVLKQRVYLSLKGRLGLGPVPNTTIYNTSTTNISRNKHSQLNGCSANKNVSIISNM